MLYGLGGWLVALLPVDWNWAYQFPALMALGLTLYVSWQASFRLALLPAAQPLSLAFGGQAAPVDYARALADSSTLALVACLGLAQLSHEVSPVPFWTLGMSMHMLAAAHLLSPRRERFNWRWAAWQLGGMVVLVLSGQGLFSIALGFMVLGWLKWGTCKDEPDGTRPIKPWGAATTALIATFLWIWLFDIPVRWDFGNLSSFSLRAFLQLLAWYTWPAWPLAIWTLWKWHRQWRMIHVLVPASLSFLGLLVSVMAGGADEDLVLTLPPLATLAALALPTLRRSASALVDWFSLLFFSFCALAIWVVWVAMQTGVPRTPAYNVAKLAPGFVPVFESLAFLVALAATLAWIWVVFWRTSHHPSGIWKSLVIPATGSTLSWLLLMTLWLPLLNHARSYQGLVTRLTPYVPSGACVTAWRLQEAPIAALIQQGQLEVQRGNPKDSSCPLLIAPASRDLVPSDMEPNWTPVVRVSRLTDNKETLVLWSRTGMTKPINPVQPGRVETAN